ncbi:GCN5 family acetyltransferase [Chryseobacterium sp. Leaf180]|uniref:GNAT family N-acetyltransferase n=1 Tax=Chryseobacterium sp. Leaf180 TaxID=1736289 RepID=UPI0006F91386|nr:GNAT family N-acetyltransferase [Chryseobacterium sp. Leaf180]KQR95651.1 GCN5 family acetyltransferase [Chryseobacterium sp. Leaf180]
MKTNELQFRLARNEDHAAIWKIIQQAIDRRKQEGSEQWQSGYPNEGTITEDITSNHGFVLTSDGEIAAYTALIFNDEPAYADIDGKWLTDGDFFVIHRVAVSEKFAGKGLVKILFDQIENYVKSQNVPSIKVDTNFDNPAMISIIVKKGYRYCGEVMLAGGMRKAYEKVLK